MADINNFQIQKQQQNAHMAYRFKRVIEASKLKYVFM